MEEGGNCAWCLVITFIFMGLVGTKRWRELLKVNIWGRRREDEKP